MNRLVYLAGLLLVVGFIFSLLSPAPGIFGSATAPVAKSEMWTLNPD